jgi:hypothetical protein
MSILWTAQVHLLTPPAEFGDTRCFVNVAAWGKSPADFAAHVSTIFSRRSWTVLSIMHCRRAEQNIIVSDELAQQIEEASKEEGSCIFGTLHYYPSRPS